LVGSFVEQAHPSSGLRNHAPLYLDARRSQRSEGEEYRGMEKYCQYSPTLADRLYSFQSPFFYSQDRLTFLGQSLLGLALFQSSLFCTVWDNKYCWICPSTALRTPIAISVNASSVFDQLVTALPSLGKALSLPNGASFQSHARRMMGITCASPASCLSIALSISIL